MCDIDLGDGCEAWSETRIKHARKEHRCASCGAHIRVGRSYWRRSYVFDGSAGAEACCDPCWVIAEAFGAAHHQTPTPSSLLDTLEQCIDYDDESAKRWRRAAGQIRGRMTRARRLREASSDGVAVGAP